MTVETNHTISVDCVIFGYDSDGLKILLVEQRPLPNETGENRLLKLPGSMIFENETLPDAAHRVLLERTGLERVYLKQTAIFSDPNRVDAEEIKWIAKYHNISTSRVVTVGYYALVQITPRILKYTVHKRAKWQPYNTIPKLAMDHNVILRHALRVLRNDFETSPIAFELLPRKFTIRELQQLYSTIMGVSLDNRNFRKKILSTEYVKATGEKQKNVAHKPAEYYTFNLSAFKRRRGELAYL